MQINKLNFIKNNKSLRQPFKGVTTEEARTGRLDFLKSLNKKIPSFNDSYLEAKQVKSNIESFIGTMSIPVGLVGPLLFEKEKGEFEHVFTNVATTEGALVASMNRGASIISACGGFKAHVERSTMLRAPMFSFSDIYEAKEFSHWLIQQKDLLNQHIKKYSKRAELTQIKPTLMGKNVDCKFYYKTGDAAGQNMTTICTWHSCLWIEEKFNQESSFKIKDFILEANGASDKKVSHHSIANGRGTSVVAECIIDEEMISKKLKTSSEAITNFFNRSYQLTSHDGMIGNNVNVANALAAIFAVTGQDIACLHESSVGFLSLEKHPRGLYMSLRLPRLVIGTVGGGTGLPHQKESLQLMDCYGTNKLERFAKLIAGFTLGLELSTMSAMTSHQFAIAHETLGRNKPVNFFTTKELTQSFVNQNLVHNPDENMSFLSYLDDSNGIITQLTGDKVDKHIGLSLWKSQKNQEIAILKSKATDDEALNCMYILTGMVDPSLAKSFGNYNQKSEFLNCHKKELKIYDFFKKNPSIYSPKVYGTYQNDSREMSMALIEFFSEEKMLIINSETNPDIWTDKYFNEVMYASLYLQKSLSQIDTKEAKIKFQGFKDFSTFSKHAIEVLTNEYSEKYSELISLLESSWKYLEKNEEKLLQELPLSVVHNDFNPRNVGISKDGIAKVYDWELAAIDFPQRDLVEMLSFINHSKNMTLDLNLIIQRHLNQYNLLNKTSYSFEVWKEGFKHSFSKFLITRFAMYLLGNKLSPYPFTSVLIDGIKNLEESGLKLC